MTTIDLAARETFSGGPTTAEEFDEALAALLESAYANGVDVEGCWVYRNGPDMPDWELRVDRLAKRNSRC